ncbi:hypothetical protein [Anaerotignum lactatifermentans]|uniref:hypothetical protein n=1 Tax=Anaerotignum lactatifermentans TaxID=160404 RepID=UPI0039F5AF6F
MAEQDTAALTSNLFSPFQWALQQGQRKPFTANSQHFPKNPSRCPFVPLAITSPNPVSHRHTGGHVADKCLPSLWQGQQGQFFASPPKNRHYRHFFSFLHLWKTHISPDFKGFSNLLSFSAAGAVEGFFCRLPSLIKSIFISLFSFQPCDF